MKKFINFKSGKILVSSHFWFFVTLFVFLFVLLSFVPGFLGTSVFYAKSEQSTKNTKPDKKTLVALPPLDTAAYDALLNKIANNPVPEVVAPQKDQEGNEIPASTPPVKPTLWPVKTVYPNAGAILPFKRIVAYYGNLYSTRMGVLGQYPEAEMLERLKAEVEKWNAADPSIPAIPALHYIAVVAQLNPGESGKYRLRMPSTEIEKVLAMAEKINAIVFLDIQVGFSNVETEIPLLEKYLKMPNVHLGIDPEFSMKNGIRPGKVVGTLDAADINFASDYLAKLVKENNLTPKVLTIHRYTQKMVTNYQEIKTRPEVQIVMHMDGWGGEAKKINTYNQFIHKEPVQFTGFKLFYKNDVLTPGTTLMTPESLLKLNPIPVYIQYQ